MLSTIHRSYIIKNISLVRQFSSSYDFLKVQTDDNGMSVMSLNRPPVNSLNLQMMSEIETALQHLTKDKCQGLILTSESSKVFCAGLDISELIKPVTFIRQFWSQLQDMWLCLYSVPFPTAAAISGHAPAGGCLLSIACDYRVIAGPKTIIGLNEVKVGFMPPPWVQESMKNVVGSRQAEMALTNGTLFCSDDALKVGLVDKVVSTKEEAMASAAEFLEQQTFVPSVARSMTKLHYRRKLCQWFSDNKQADIEQFAQLLTRQEVKQGIEKYLLSLKK